MPVEGEVYPFYLFLASHEADLGQIRQRLSRYKAFGFERLFELAMTADKNAMLR